MNNVIHKLKGIAVFILSGCGLNLIKEEAVAYSLLVIFAIIGLCLILKERVN